MTKSELIKAMEEFPDDIPIRFELYGNDREVTAVTEICPTETDTSENYLLLS